MSLNNIAPLDLCFAKQVMANQVVVICLPNDLERTR